MLPTSPTPRIRIALLLAALGTGLFAWSLVTPAWWLRIACAPICHQNPDRTLHLFGAWMAVCSRCSGLYFGAALATLVAAVMPSRLRAPARLWFFSALAPTAIDALLPWVGLSQLSLVPRHFLAWPAGFAAGWFFSLAVAEVAAQIKIVGFEHTVEVGDG